MIGPFCGLLSLLVAGRYVEVILQLIEKAGDFVSDDIWYRVVQFVTNNDDLQVLTCGPSFLDVRGNMENGLKILYCIHHNVYTTTLDHYRSESCLLCHLCLSCAFRKHAPTSTYLVPDIVCSESGLLCRVWQLSFLWKIGICCSKGSGVPWQASSAWNHGEGDDHSESQRLMNVLALKLLSSIELWTTRNSICLTC